MRRTRLLLVLIFSACAPATASIHTDVAPGLAGVQHLVGDRLFFGQGIPGGGMVPDTAWTSFLRDIVTKHFPEGMTVWRAEGQWTGPRGDLVHEPVMIVEVFHPRGSPPDSIFSSIAREYVRRFHQDAVLRTTFDVGTRLYTEQKK